MPPTHALTAITLIATLTDGTALGAPLRRRSQIVAAHPTHILPMSLPATLPPLSLPPDSRNPRGQ